MKTKKYHTIDVQHPKGTSPQPEIDSFLKALYSYPERFANQPDLSFQQYLLSIPSPSDAPSREK
ncbi:MAG TPA: hypothetical protein VGP35_01485 [Terriglobales bacterium]|jgi:hypothetical protein|nr:hypothetical protein [Terriglobales bacterium]